MPLRCLLFSSNEELVQPIWQVLTDLGIEGEYCQSAVDAVERVTTQLFQIVITDWEDQPEAAFLLKTARDLKAAQRPLTLAIVSDDAKLPEALQAGANSVLVKPIRAEQVRDTMSTACELLRAKQQQAASPLAGPVAQQEAPATAALAAAASAGGVSVPPSVIPASVTQSPEKTFRAGEFLQSPSSAPGAQFDTETECEVQKSLDQAAAAEVDALTELEPMAAAMEDTAAEPVEAQPAEPQEALTGWASLQARLTKTAPPPAEAAPAKSEMLSYGETQSFGASAAAPAEEGRNPEHKHSQPESGSEAALFAYMSRETNEGSEPAEQAPPKHSKLFLVGALAVTCAVLVAVPRTRQSLRMFSRSAARAGGSWLNPPPAPLPQAAVQHDSFGQSGDEYNLPVAGNIPDATTDPSQIRVLPVIDPTAKPEKGAEANSGQAQATVGENSSTDPNQTGPNLPAQSQTTPSQSTPSQTTPSQSEQVQVGESQIKDPTTTATADAPGNATTTQPVPVPPAAQGEPSAPVVQAASPLPRPVAPLVQSSVPPAQSSSPPHVASAANSAGIPSSLKSQIASMTPESSGAKPDEAAMSSIEPVNLPEPAARELLSQPVDPVYPDAAKASGQRGSVVLQVLVGRDGAVQDAKFLQGSLVFARAAIDAVKQWRFKPYSMNGRAVSVQTTITLKFAPLA
jgi:protein TonB